MSKTITISEPVLDEILRRQLDNMDEGQSASTTLFRIKEEIVQNTMSVDDQIREQANEVIKRKETEFKERFERTIEDAVAKEKAVLTNTFSAKIDAARKQGHEQGAKDAVSLQQQLDDAHRAKAVAQTALAEKKDPFKNKHPDVFTLDAISDFAGTATRTKDGVYYREQGGAILIRCRKTAFQTAWLKEIKQAMTEPYANYAIIVSVCAPGPRQRKEVLDANRAGVYVCSPEGLRIVAELTAQWIAKENAQTKALAVKDDVKGELYDFVVGGEMAVMQSMFHDQMKAEDKAIKSLEQQIAHLKNARDKKLATFNRMVGEMQTKAGVKKLT